MPIYQDLGIDPNIQDNQIDYGNPNYDGMGNNGPLLVYNENGGSNVNFNELENSLSETNPTTETNTTTTSGPVIITSEMGNNSSTSEISTVTTYTTQTGSNTSANQNNVSVTPKTSTNLEVSPKLEKPITFFNKNKNYIFILLGIAAISTGIYYYKFKK